MGPISSSSYQHDDRRALALVLNASRVRAHTTYRELLVVAAPGSSSSVVGWSYVIACELMDVCLDVQTAVCMSE